MLKIQKFIFSPFSENTFVVWDEGSRDACVIDPGCNNENEEKELESFITQNNLNIKYLINTHCHIDHIFGNAFVKENFNPVFLAPKGDIFLLEKAEEQAALFGIDIKLSPKPDNFIEEKVNIALGSIKGKFLFTPGHTPGEFCVYFENEKICFTGDALFKEGIGRTDLWGGNFNTLIQSIKEKLLSLPDDVRIYPGHGEASTIGYEKSNNSFLS